MSTLSSVGGVGGSLASSWVATNIYANILTANNNPAGAISTLAVVSGVVLTDLGVAA
jgi:hypothetical protein